MLAAIQTLRKPLLMAAAVAVTALALLMLRSPAMQASARLPAAALAAYPGPSPTPGPPQPDNFEVDNTCAAAKDIALDTVQTHTFHDQAEQDWLRFTAQANTTYIVEITKVGPNANPVLTLYDACGAPQLAFASNPYSNKVQFQWNAGKNGDYFLLLAPYDPTLAGGGTDYTVKISRDDVPPSPPVDPRCFSINTSTIGVQWQRSASLDTMNYLVRYSRVNGTEEGLISIVGAATTYAEIGALTPQEDYSFEVYAQDFGKNTSLSTGKVTCKAIDPPDKTAPVITLQNPIDSQLYTTTGRALTFAGLVADSGRNLSRVHVANLTRGDDGWDYSLAGASDSFRVEDMRLQVGLNEIEVTALDEVGNSSVRKLHVYRQGAVQGAAIIVAGHNDNFGLQINIYNAANRAFRIFQAAGFENDNIYYLAPTPQDADGDGTSDVDAVASPGALQNAFDTWARQGSRTGPGKPLFVYLVDHGLEEKFCVSGCASDQSVTPNQLNTWLDALETATGADQVNVILEACRSGSFIDKNGSPLGGLGKQGRVIISSTGAQNNAYASAEGAYFSDIFFSCAANSNDLKTCFDQGVAAVRATGINQTPWLDDNGDGLFTAGDGALAQARHLTNQFGSSTPTIDAVSVTRLGASGTLTAAVTEGLEEIQYVWANVYPPGFQEPNGATINLNAPTVRLEPVYGSQGQYRFTYVNGFAQSGNYRLVFYAQDRLGINAMPQQLGAAQIFLPTALR